MTTYGRAIMVKQSDPQKAQRRMRVDTNNGQQTFVVHPNWRTAKMAHFRKFPKQRNQWDRSPYYGDLDPRIAGTPQEHRSSASRRRSDGPPYATPRGRQVLQGCGPSS